MGQDTEKMYVLVVEVLTIMELWQWKGEADTQFY